MSTGVGRTDSKMSTDTPKPKVEETKATAVGGGFNLNSDLADTLKSRTASEEDFIMGGPDERVPLE